MQGTFIFAFESRDQISAFFSKINVWKHVVVVTFMLVNDGIFRRPQNTEDTGGGKS